MMKFFNSKLLVSSLAVLALTSAGCDTENNPLLGTPSAGTTSINLSIPQVGTEGKEVNRIFLRILDQTSAAITTGFQLGNFSLLESGRPSVPTNVGPVTEPLYTCIAIDRSGSMAGSRTTAANAAAVDLVNNMDAAYSAAIVDFNSEATLVQSFTSDKGTLAGQINSGVAEGGTAVYDGAAFCSDLLQQTNGRKLLLVLTDGDDNSSSLSVEEVIAKINQNGQSGYFVALGSGLDTSIIQRIADETGGSLSISITGTDLSAIFLSILNSFENLTFLEYRRRTEGGLTVFMNFGALTAQASKSFD